MQSMGSSFRGAQSVHIKMASFFRPSLHKINKRISSELEWLDIERFRVITKELPSYRFVDVYRATDAFCGTGTVRIIDSIHPEDLNTILHGRPWGKGSFRIVPSNNLPWPVGTHDETYLPVDRFWVFTSTVQGVRGRLVIRVRYNEFRDLAFLEVASETESVGEKCIKAILDRSVERSIYRNKTLEMTYKAATKDEYGDIAKVESLQILFKESESVEDTDIIIDEEVRQTLRRNVIDLHERREVLKANKVPIRRGVLFYGPPGTGKTFACRYLCGKLPEATKIIVTGTALLQVDAIFTVARMLQPSLLILEDVDLVFSSRETNPYNSVMGVLFDQMDGLRPNDEIGFVLTTNAIDRMEAAIKDRPGRVSQCIYFGPPEPELRERYLLHYLDGYDAEKLDIGRLVKESDRATQAFLKEWVHRSVQIASERLQGGDGDLELRNDDFRTAMDEMKRFSEGSTGQILGFHG